MRIPIIEYAKYTERIFILMGRKKNQNDGVHSPFNDIPGIDPNREDQDNIECGEFVLGNLGSANTVNRTKVNLDVDMRDQWTGEQIDDLQDTVNLAKMGPRRN